MLTILLKILSILGILLLVLLGLLLLVILTVLFVPITYRVKADKQDKLHIAAGLNWLLGVVRVRFFYPVPGNVTVKVLCFKVFDSASGSAEPPEAPDDEKETASRAEESGTSGGAAADRRNAGNEADRAQRTERQDTAARDMAAQDTTTQDMTTQATQDAETQDEAAQNKTAREKSAQQNSGMSENRGPIEKLQYTFRNICDRIKDIRENIAYYREILLSEDTKGLLNHAFLRLGKILKSIRPRKLKADVRFGTGSPDTTGYAFAVYGILCPYLGKEVLLVPDFENAVLEGEFYAAGHITVFRILWNGLMLVMDKRLRELISKLRREE